MKKSTLFLALLLPLAIFAKEKPTVQQLFSVQTVKVKKVNTSHSKKNYGYVVADEARIYDVSPRFGGFVEKLYADKIYKYVKKGEPLVTLYSPEVYKAKEDYLNSYNYAKIRNNKGMLKSAKRKLELLGVDAREIAAVLKEKNVSPNTTIYAPTSGYIFTKNIVNGAAFNAKNRLFEIVNLDEIWVETKIFEDDVNWIKNANTFEVSFKTTPKIYKTSNKLLYPNLDPKEATLTMRLRLKNPDHRLFPGMYADVLSRDKARTYLTLPQSAVIRKDGRYYAFMIGEFEGEYEPVEVSVKPLNNQTYIILDGLSAGDEVVNNALFMMDSDAQINGLY
ncbi:MULTISPECIES: efflux RND transporter periplasmic adaptor subunit [Sulfurimonas]|uniref:efflux RND transporter periplasmic adaptor subunit n=1 Tax=Sulfurimonas TaxID=202746 RepID=UPI001263F0E4|nr:efflux RND transporter periplasmic adaptor subunit [Sulfurimonas indica]